MTTDRSFKIALTLSLVAHVAIFFKFSQMSLLPKHRSINKVEVTYLQDKYPLPSLESYTQKLPKNSSYQTSSKEIALPPQVEKEPIFKDTKTVTARKPDFSKSRIVAMKKKVSLPSLNTEKITNPDYLNYYQLIREKIKQTAYKNYTRLVNGEVYLSFIILNSGDLKEIRIDSGGSSGNNYLKNVAERSIRESSPFPKFPKDLDYPELSFNVIISFEVE